MPPPKRPEDRARPNECMIGFNPHDRDIVKALAKAEGISMRALIMRAIELYRASHERKVCS